MNLTDYINSKKAPKKIKADIQERWQARVVANNMQLQGEAGAQVYLSLYGKGIAAPKCLDLAFCALANDAPEMANGFFKKAAQLEGVELSDDGNLPNPNLAANAQGVIRGANFNHLVMDTPHPGFPKNMQPGCFAPMQPDDAKKERKDYIEDYCYWGQPKIDGNKLIVFATPDEVFYQSRQMKLNPMPDAEMNSELRIAARELGNFILEGELTYLDCKDKEHRTAAQALTANIELGQPNYRPEMKYCVFSCVWRNEGNLQTYGEMVNEGKRIALYMQQQFRSDWIAPIFTGRTALEKRDLALAQHSGGREGEVWFHHQMPYLPGKHKDDRFARTKYLTEFTAIVTGFTETTAEGHAFGAMCIQSLDGKDLGNVGTGFTREDKYELMRRFRASQHGNSKLRVEIRCQGFTEGAEPKAWHARFLRIVE